MRRPVFSTLLLRRAARRFGRPLAILLVLHVIGTAGYRWIGGPDNSLIDCLYMTFITIATIGFGEVIDLKDSPAGRVFTILLGAAGIANTWYLLSVLTAFILEGEINNALRRRRMLKAIAQLSDHYIVCGIGRVGTTVTHELAMTGRPFLVVDIDRNRIDEHREHNPNVVFLHGDAAEDAVLAEAGIARAAGVFAITGDDAKNLVISLSAKQLNPAARVVARCHEVSYIEKMRRVGADAIVSPDFSGGIDIAASMLRPQVVNFLEDMMRSEEAYRFEQVAVPTRLAGKTIESLEPRTRDHVLIGLKAGARWHYNPPDDHLVQAGDVLLYMVTPAARDKLVGRFAG